VIAGNSIAQDRLFINRYFPRFASKLHYRMLDVTAWKVVMEARFGIRFEKKKAHRALDDIRESLDEMRFYLRHVVPNPP
jgi:oligoribonuclease